MHRKGISPPGQHGHKWSVWRAKPGHTCLPGLGQALVAPRTAPPLPNGVANRRPAAAGSLHRSSEHRGIHQPRAAKNRANGQCGAQNQVTPAYRAWDNAHEPSEPRSFGPAHENVASFESIQQARWHQNMGAGRTFLGGGAAARGARPLVAAASRRPISNSKLVGQALAAAEPHEGEHERGHGLQAVISAAAPRRRRPRRTA
eukprot:SAG31_NODE_6188_length_2131_cov_84.969980_2_plen_202_part_00